MTRGERCTANHRYERQRARHMMKSQSSWQTGSECFVRLSNEAGVCR
jgi:hypothetical protein